MSKKDLQKELSEKANEHSARSPKTPGSTLMLRFICPKCGCRDLRTKFPEPLYQISTLDKIEIGTGNLVDYYIDEREPSEWRGVGHNDGWEFWCDDCHLVPNLKEYGDMTNMGGDNSGRAACKMALRQLSSDRRVFASQRRRPHRGLTRCSIDSCPCDASQGQATPMHSRRLARSIDRSGRTHEDHKREKDQFAEREWPNEPFAHL